MKPALVAVSIVALVLAVWTVNLKTTIALQIGKLQEQDKVLVMLQTNLSVLQSNLAVQKTEADAAKAKLLEARKEAKAAIISALEQLHSLTSQVNTKGVSQTRADQLVLQAFKQVNVDRCPVAFQKAWSAFLFQSGEDVNAEVSQNRGNLLKLAGVVATGGATWETLLTADTSDTAKGVRAAAEQLRLVLLDYGISSKQ